MEDPVSSNKSFLNSRDESSSREPGVVLETFGHQVGGRSLILTYDRNTVCKPLDPQEHRFYLDLPRSLRPFTPSYKGVVSVDVHVTDGGGIKLVTNPDKLCDADVNHNMDQVESNQFSAGIQDCNDYKTISQISDLQAESKTGRVINPWTFHCQDLHFNRLKESVANNKSMDFILMEDVVQGFVLPCIMDLKMGNTLHNHHRSQEKYHQQLAKWNASTSKSLGLRIAGIQVYKDASKNYVYQNKYYGFQLTEQGFKDELVQFVHNGKHVRKKVVAAFLDKLQRLYTCIKEQAGYRYYSSSLLLIYDGHEGLSRDDPSHQVCVDCSPVKPNDFINEGLPLQDHQIPNGRSTSVKVGVKMIDFGRSFHSQHQALENVKGPDEGYLIGLTNLMMFLKEILHEGEGSCVH